jgi:uncharacterized repeat protein (TIGR02543 family)
MKKHGMCRLIILTALAILAASLAGVLAGCDFDQIKYEWGFFERPQNYTVTYEAPGEGITGDVPPPQTVPAGTSIPLADPNWPEFSGWLTADGVVKGEEPKPAGSLYTVTGNTTFYAQWTPAETETDTSTYTVTYNLNGGSGTPPVQNGVTGLVQIASATDLTPPEDGLVFVGWTKNENGSGTRYRAGSANSSYVNVTKDITLYAQWGYSVTYNASGATAGTLPATAYLLPSETLTVASGRTLKKNGMNFIAWRLDEEEGDWDEWYFPKDTNTTGYNATLSVTSNITLYAVYPGVTTSEGYVVFYAKESYSVTDTDDLPESWRFLVAAPQDREDSSNDYDGENWPENGRIAPGWNGSWVNVETEFSGNLASMYFFERENWPVHPELRYYQDIPSGTAIGTGKQNTKARNEFTPSDPENFYWDSVTYSAAYYSTNAGDIYDNDMGIEDDWFLPSKDELLELYKFVVRSGNTLNLDTTYGVYWSSSNVSDGDNKSAWAVLFGQWNEGLNRSLLFDGSVWDSYDVPNPSFPKQGDAFAHAKKALHKVRPVRRF